MSTSAAVPSDHPIMKAWTEYTGSPEFANTKKWAKDDMHVVGSLWAAFVAGWNCRGGDSHSGPIDGA